MPCRGVQFHQGQQSFTFPYLVPLQGESMLVMHSTYTVCLHAAYNDAFMPHDVLALVP